jgi:hypothetical protein
MKNNFCNDVDGNILSPYDWVVVLDADDLEGIAPKRGDILAVYECVDAESNYIKYVSLDKTDYGFYGHRVLKLNK